MAFRPSILSLFLLLGLVGFATPAWTQEDAAPAEAAEAPAEETALGQVNKFFAPVDGFWGSYVNSPIAYVFFFDLWFWDNDEVVTDPVTGRSRLNPVNLPLAVAWLIVGAVFFTIKMRFVNLRGFKHAIAVVRGSTTTLG